MEVIVRGKLWIGKNIFIACEHNAETEEDFALAKNSVVFERAVYGVNEWRVLIWKWESIKNWNLFLWFLYTKNGYILAFMFNNSAFFISYKLST